jgi:hypothetical protein
MEKKEEEDQEESLSGKKERKTPNGKAGRKEKFSTFPRSSLLPALWIILTWGFILV